MTLFDLEREHEPYEVVPGAIHAPGWLTADEQQQLVAAFDDWAAGPVPLRSASVRGHPMSSRRCVWAGTGSRTGTRVTPAT